MNLHISRFVRRLLGRWFLILGLAAGPVFAQSDTILIKGHRAHSTRLLAKVKSAGAVTAQATQATLSSLGVGVAETLGPVEGMVVLDALANQPVLQAAPGAKDPKVLAAQMLARIETLQGSGLFEYVEPDYIVTTTLTPNDAAFTDGRLWGLRNQGQNGGTTGADMGTVAAWDITTGSTDVIVAVIDSGIRYTHRDLAAQMWRNPGEIPGNNVDDDADGYIDNVFGINAITSTGNPLDDQGHGTHVAGTIGAAPNDGNAHVGVAWNVRLMACKFLDASGSGKTSDAIKCINFAVSKGARVLNNSWGGGGFSQSLFLAIRNARNQGVLFVAAAGNDGSNNDVTAAYPASYDLDNIVSVAALNRNDQLAGFSNFGQNRVHVGAPGVDIYSCGIGSDTDYKFLSGTSMATPHVSGLAALLLAKFPGISLAQLRNQILGAVVPIGALSGKATTGGRVNAFQSLNAAPDGTLELTVSPPAGSVLLAGSTVPVKVTVTDLGAVANAVVTVAIAGSTNLVVNNNGAAPDDVANDATYSAHFKVPVFTNGATLNITVTAPGKTGASLQATYVIATPAVNDDFEKRTAISGDNINTTGSNLNASKQGGEPDHAGDPGGRSVWWTWTAPSAGIVSLNTANSSFDTTLAVYTGTAVNGLAPVAANDDASGGVATSALKFNTAAGAVYQIAVDGFGGAAGEIQLQLALAVAPPAPPTDAFGNGATLTGGLVTLAGSTVGATKQAGEPNHAGVIGGASVWYTWTAPSNGVATVSTFGSTFDTVLAIYTGTDVAQLAEVAANDDDPNGGITSVVAFTATGGTTYQFAIDGFNAAAGSFDLSLSMVGAASVPANDLFENAITISGNNTSVNGSNLGATKSAGEPDHAFALGGQSVWWKWTAPQAGSLTVTTSGSSFDTLLGVYTGTAVDALDLAGGNDDENVNTRTSRVVIEVAAGETYRIAVDGYQDAFGNVAAGVIQLGLALSPVSPPPPNDNFADRIQITGQSVRVTGTTAGATVEDPEPLHVGNLGGRSVWWTWTAPVTGFYTITTSGSDFDTLLAVYGGSEFGSLTDVVASDEDPATFPTSRVIFQATAGTAYQIAVDGYQEGAAPAAFGNVVLSIIPAGAESTLFSTEFEAAQGYQNQGPLGGVNGWQLFGSGGQGIISGYITGQGQHGYVGFSAPAANTDVTTVWQPINATPVAGQIYRFRTTMTIEDSTEANGNYDYFRWSVYTPAGDRLFSLEFDNFFRKINFILETGGPVDTGFTFENGVAYDLEILMDFSHNWWSASLGGVVVAASQAISTLGHNTALGDIDAVWALGVLNQPGNNFMVFDNYRVTSVAPVVPPTFTTQPTSKTINVGGNTSFTVDATGTDPIGFQWYHNGVALPGQTAKTLNLSGVTTNQAGGYAAVATNLIGSATSLTAVLTVTVVIPPPVNDNFASRLPLSGSTVMTSGVNVGATLETGEPVHAGKAGGRSVWWQWTAPANGFVTVSTLGSEFDTLLGVYTGTAVNGLTLVAANDDGQSRVRGSLLTFQAQLGVSYHIAVDGYNGDAGNIQLSIKPTTTPIFGQPTFGGANGLQFAFTGEPGVTYIIQSSTNLKTWTSVTSVFTANGTFQFADPQAGNSPFKFYRAFQEP